MTKMQVSPSDVSSGKVSISIVTYFMGAPMGTCWSMERFAPGRRLCRWQRALNWHRQAMSFFILGHKNLWWALAPVLLTPWCPPVRLGCKILNTYSQMACWATSLGVAILSAASAVWYRIPSLWSSCSKRDQYMWIAALSPWISLRGGFWPASIHDNTFEIAGSADCHSWICITHQDSQHRPPALVVSTFFVLTECPRQHLSSDWCLISCWSQCRHWLHGLRDKPSPFLCWLPGRWSISK